MTSRCLSWKKPVRWNARLNWMPRIARWFAIIASSAALISQACLFLPRHENEVHIARLQIAIFGIRSQRETFTRVELSLKKLHRFVPNREAALGSFKVALKPIRTRQAIVVRYIHDAILGGRQFH